MSLSSTYIISFFLALLVIGIFCSCSVLRKPYSKDLSSITDKTCNELHKLYGLECIGLGLGLDHNSEPKKVQELYYTFTEKKLMTHGEARILILNTINVFMKNIIENKNFLEFYAVDDFDEGNVKISIIFLTPDGQKVLDPYIASASSANYNLNFSTNDPEKPNLYKSEIRETIEEARQKALSE